MGEVYYYTVKGKVMFSNSWMLQTSEHILENISSSQ